MLSTRRPIALRHLLVILSTVLCPWTVPAQETPTPVEAGTLTLLQEGEQLLDENPVEAAIDFKLALDMAKETENSLLLADCHAMLGHTYFLIGDHFAALNHHQQALDLYIELGADARAAAQLSKIGSTYYFSKVGDLEKTKAYYEAAARWYLANDMPTEAAFNLNYTAYTVWAQGDKAAALKIHKEALKTFESIQDHKGMATALSDIGFTLNSLSQYESALEYCQRALDLERAHHEVLMQVPTLNNIAIAHMGLGQYDAALRYSQMSYEMAQKRDLLLRQSEALKTLYQVYEKLEDFENAYHTLVLYTELNDQVMISNQARQILEAEMSQEFHEKEQALRYEADKERSLAAEKLRREQLRNTALLTILILTLLLLAVFLRCILQKRRSTRILSAQQQALRQKNKALKQSMQELRQAQDEMIRLEKEASLALLTEGAAHEINNPMNFIQGGVYTIRDELERDEAADMNDIREALDQIQEGIERTAKIINGLYTFNRQKAELDLERFDLNAYLSEWVAKQNEVTQCYLQLLSSDPAQQIEVETDKDVLAEVLIRVVQNGCEAMQNEGMVEIQSIASDSGWVVIEVRDKGVGISKDNLKRVFDPFFTTKPTCHSVGLGLTFAQKWMSVLSGSIDIRSTPGQGTTVQIHMPTPPHTQT